VRAPVQKLGVGLGEEWHKAFRLVRRTEGVKAGGKSRKLPIMRKACGGGNGLGREERVAEKVETLRVSCFRGSLEN